MMMPSIAMAKSPLSKGQQVMQYDVYAGGIHALKSNLAINLSGTDTYSVNLETKTYGLLGKMAPWEGAFNTKGWRTETGTHPEKHQSIGVWRGESEKKEYFYNEDKSFQSYIRTKQGKEPQVRKTTDELTKGTSDMLTATLNTMMDITKNGKCEGTTDVFDGKRRFQLIFKEKQKVELEKSRWNVYTGPAIECTAEVKPMAGKWHEKPRGWMSIQEQGRERGTMPTIWFASITEGQPAIPVKVRVKTSYGTLFMHMTKYETAGKTLTISK